VTETSTDIIAQKRIHRRLDAPGFVRLIREL
jgi:hypothetical protein